MSARPFRLTPPVRGTEHQLQKLITDVLRIELAPPGRVSRFGVVWFAIDAADYGGAVPGTRVGRGLVGGCPDLFLLYAGLAHFIELKRTDGVLSDGQRSVVAALCAGSGRVGVATSVDDVLGLLDAWAIPRANRVRRAA